MKQHAPTHTPKICLQCKEEFQALLKDHKRGRAKFCSRKCSGKYKTENFIPKEHNVICSWCKKDFYKNDSKKKLSKSGLFFCSRKCKDTAQGLFGLKELHLPHYGQNGHAYYRRKAFSVKPKKCERCPYDEHEAAIIVHHKDRNRMNDDISNLEVLCCNCHAIEHWGKPDQIIMDD